MLICDCDIVHTAERFLLFVLVTQRLLLARALLVGLRGQISTVRFNHITYIHAKKSLRTEETRNLNIRFAESYSFSVGGGRVKYSSVDLAGPVFGYVLRSIVFDTRRRVVARCVTHQNDVSRIDSNDYTI